MIFVITPTTKEVWTADDWEVAIERPTLGEMLPGVPNERELATVVIVRKKSPKIESTITAEPGIF